MNAENHTMASAASGQGRSFGIGAFVAALRARLRDTPAETPLPEQLEAAVRQVEGGPAAGEKLAARFARAATSMGATVHRTSLSDWLDVVAGVLRAHRAEAVLVPRAGDGLFDTERAAQLRTRLVAERISAATETDDETLFSVNASVTGVVAAIAETGTLVCESSPRIARGASLIPLVHVAVVGVAQVLPDLCDCLRGLGDRPELPANVSLITGPSKTADIEGVLVIGVHGPGEVHIVLVEGV
jgi:L-lactate dehydrogenase complex protein LldG